MDRVQVESIELDEQLWQKWVQKGRLRDQVRKRRWRITCSVVTGLLLLAGGVYRWIFAI